MSLRDYFPPQFLNGVICEKNTAKDEGGMSATKEPHLVLDSASLIFRIVVIDCSFRLGP
ncbi:unnamed protein product [Rhodiola kirilowii]